MAWWHAILSTYPVLVLSGLVILTVFSGYGVWKLEYSNSITDLLPTENQVVGRYLHVVKDFGIAEDIIVAIEEENGDAQNAQLFFDIFLELVQEDDRYDELLRGVDYNLSQKLDLIFTPFLLEHVSVLMPPDILEAFVERLSPASMNEIMRRNRELLETGTGSTLLVEKDPLQLLGLMSSLSSQMQGKYELDFPGGYYSSRDHQLLLAFFKPIDSADNIEYTQELMDFLIEMREATIAEFAEESDSPDTVSLQFTGAHAITYYDRAVMENDMSSTFLLSFALVLLVFVLAYRNPFSFFYAAVPLLLGELWAFGLAYYIVGGLNLLTSVTAAIIVGLGIDFAIHLYSRFLDELSANEDRSIAMQIAFSETGASTLAGGLTTAAAFSAMMMASFRGLREFGVIASLGILCTLLAVTTVLPMMFMLRKKLRRTRRMTQFGLHFFHAAIDRFHKPVFILLTVVTVFMTYQASQLRITTSMRELRSETNPALQLQTTITEKLKASFRSLTIMLTAESEEELEQRYARLHAFLERDDVARVESVYNIVPGTAAQAASIELLASRDLPENVVDTFKAAFDDAGMVCDPYCETYVTCLDQSLRLKSPLTLDHVLSSSMAPLFERMVKKRAGRYEMAVNVFPSVPTWDRENMDILIDDLNSFMADQGWTGENYLTGIELVVGEIKRLIKENFYLSTLLSLLSVFLIVYLHQRSFRLTMLSFFPLLAGIAWMLGAMHLLGDDITLYNFMATPMIIGIGIDQGIHLLDRFIAGRDGDIAEAVIHTGKAITFTALTTIIGFGSLFISHFNGFASLGMTTILGVAFCWVASLLYFPSFLKLVYGNRRFWPEAKIRKRCG